jgi:RimJ/RimL family protein N-acetyltransferase
MRQSLAELWPPFALRVVAGPLELRIAADDDIPALVELVRAGVHEPDAMPFAQPWTDVRPDRLGPNTVAYHWRTRAELSPERWTLDLAVRYQGRLAGIQGISTRDYLVTRTGETGSWLGREFQGRGIGTLMRQAICALLFDHLDAYEISSAAFTDNPVSFAVSRKVGYVENGLFREQRRPGELALNQKLLLTREAFVRGPDPLQVQGVAEFRRFVGLDPAS